MSLYFQSNGCKEDLSDLTALSISVPYLTSYDFRKFHVWFCWTYHEEQKLKSARLWTWAARLLTDDGVI